MIVHFRLFPGKTNYSIFSKNAKNLTILRSIGGNIEFSLKLCSYRLVLILTMHNCATFKKKLLSKLQTTMVLNLQSYFINNLNTSEFHLFFKYKYSYCRCCYCCCRLFCFLFPTCVIMPLGISITKTLSFVNACLL